MANKIAVVIINYNGWRHTLNCLDSIAQAVEEPSRVKIFLVDNHSVDDSRVQIGSYLSEQNTLSVDFILSDENRGFSAGNNLGVKKALAEDFDAIMLLNNDTLVEQDIFAIAIRFFDELPDCTVIAGHTRRPDGTRELTCTRARPTFGNLLFLYHTPFWDKPWFPGYRQHYMLDRDLTRPFPVYAGSGACLVFRRGYFEKAGLFDENTFLFAEEFIIGETCLRHEFKSYFVPAVTLTHIGGQSVKKNSAISFIEFCKSEQYLNKYYYRFNRLFLIIFFVIRALKYIYMSFISRIYRNNVLEFLRCYL